MFIGNSTLQNELSSECLIHFKRQNVFQICNQKNSFYRKGESPLVWFWGAKYQVEDWNENIGNVTS